MHWVSIQYWLDTLLWAMNHFPSVRPFCLLHPSLTSFPLPLSHPPSSPFFPFSFPLPPSLLSYPLPNFPSPPSFYYQSLLLSPFPPPLLFPSPFLSPAVKLTQVMVVVHVHMQGRTTALFHSQLAPKSPLVSSPPPCQSSCTTTPWTQRGAHLGHGLSRECTPPSSDLHWLTLCKFRDCLSVSLEAQIGSFCTRTLGEGHSGTVHCCPLSACPMLHSDTPPGNLDHLDSHSPTWVQSVGKAPDSGLLVLA